jgi:hypothetical protein
MRIAYMILAPLLSTALAEAGEHGGGAPKPRLEPAPQRRVEPNAPTSAAGATTARTLRSPATVGSQPSNAPAPGGSPTAPSAPGTPPRTGPAPQAIEHDTVILTNEQQFLGTVLSDQPDPAWVAINTGSGVLRLARDRVARVEYGLTARMGKVKADDLAALVDLAMWCRANARNPQALELLTKAVALAGCDLKTRGLYAQLVDEQEGADKALPLYIAYRNAGGTEPEIIARLGELETARTAWEEQMRALGLDPGATAAAGAPMAAATSSAVEEGYEKYKWDSDSLDWSSPAKPTLVTLVTPEGPRRVMQVDVEAHPSKPNVDKAAIVLRRPLALRSGAKLTMLVANRGTADLRLGIAVKSGADWTYYESKPQNVVATQSGQEFTQLSFDLGASDFKAQSTGWAHSARIAHLEQVRELQILLHNGSKSGSVWIAGIAFEGGE